MPRWRTPLPPECDGHPVAVIFGATKTRLRNLRIGRTRVARPGPVEVVTPTPGAGWAFVDFDGEPPVVQVVCAGPDHVATAAQGPASHKDTFALRSELILQDTTLSAADRAGQLFFCDFDEATSNVTGNEALAQRRLRYLLLNRSYERAHRHARGATRLSQPDAEHWRTLRGVFHLTANLQTRHTASLPHAFRAFARGDYFVARRAGPGWRRELLGGHGGPNGSPYLLFAEVAFLAREASATDQGATAWQGLIPTLLASLEVFDYLYYLPGRPRKADMKSYAADHIGDKEVDRGREEEIYRHYANLPPETWEREFDSLTLHLRRDDVDRHLHHRHAGSGVVLT